MTMIDTSQMRPLEEAGYQLIPLHRWDRVSTDARGKKRDDGKRPRDGNWTRRPYDTGRVIEGAKSDGSNVGVRLRPVDLVIDYDPRNDPSGGEEPTSLSELMLWSGVDPTDWPTVRTGSGGLHIYLTKPADVAVLDSLKEFPGVEFKTVGRQVVAPGSVHPCGNHYTWISGSEDLWLGAPRVPETLFDMARRPITSASGSTEAGVYTAEELAEMLKVLDPQDFRDHDDWLKLMMACHHATAGGGLAEFVDWSTSDPEYADATSQIERRWDSLRADQDSPRVTFKTLNKILIEAGQERAIPRKSAEDDFDEVSPEDLPDGAMVESVLPKIRVGDGRLVDMVEAAKQALFDAVGEEVLQRHGELIRPLRLGRSTLEQGVRHQAGATVLMPVNEPWLQKRMAEIARWYRIAIEKSKVEGGRGSTKEHLADPPLKVVRAILNDQGAWPFYVLTGMVVTPTVDVSTGQVIDAPGIDPETGLLAVFDPKEFPRIERDVGREGAVERLRRVEHSLFRHMPFVDAGSRAVAMSALLTALVRPTLRAAPMHLFDAAMAGTGKSKMASVVGVLATGVEPSASAWASSEDENEKRIAALYRTANPVVLFDNVDARRGDRLGGNILNIVLTQDPASIRVLGKTEEETLNTRLMVLATGNNIVVEGDCCRRAVKCRLDAKCSEPERRVFDFDPVEVAKRERPRLIADLLEALSAYLTAGRPADPPPLGSFEDWTAIRGLLLWCGLADPAETIADVKATDQDRGELMTALETWRFAFEDAWVSGAELAEFVAGSGDDLENKLGRELFEGTEAMAASLFGGKSDKAWIGRELVKTNGVASGNFYLEVKSGRSAKFRVLDVNEEFL